MSARAGRDLLCAVAAASGGPCRRTCCQEYGSLLVHAMGRYGTLERVHHALYAAVRAREGRKTSRTAAIIDGPRAKAAQKGLYTDPLTRKVFMRARS